MTRRRLLEAVGGLTFLALVPVERGWAADDAPVLFTALPYLQPGYQGGPVVDGQEQIVVAWQTDNRPAEFIVEAAGKTFRPSRVERIHGDDGELCYNYAATLTGLPAGKSVAYRVRMNGKTLATGRVVTRKVKGAPTRFVAFGDNSFGDISDRMIAFQAWKARPDFVMNTGDNVYEDGSDSEYARHFFPAYNALTAGERTGAPLLASVPFYTVLANHDVHGKDERKWPAADFAKVPDSLGYFTAMHLPLNSKQGLAAPIMVGPEKDISHFKAAAGARFPGMANYSYFYGDAFFLCLDSNLYVDPTDQALQSYVARELENASGFWKFVVFHHPSFNVGGDHYAEQHMRVLSPLFEKYGVTIVFHGHEHNYQRTRPMKFAPGGPGKAANLGSKDRLVPGTFTIDRSFDGANKTRPDGVIYITTGAGGKALYDVDWNARPEKWRHAEDGHADYTARFVSDRHSLTTVDLDSNSLTLVQRDAWGQELDRIRITR
ncbi:MAG: metallophosphoesterase [Armatimonas sp.]